jgi:hypothetical protein
MSNRAINITILTVNDITLATVQKAGRNLKRNGWAGPALVFIPEDCSALALGAGSETGAETGGVAAGVEGLRAAAVEPFPRGSLERIESSTFAEVNLFILLCSFWSEAGVVIQPPQRGCNSSISQMRRSK